MFIADGEFITVQFEQAQWKLGGAVVGSAIDNLEFESTMFTTAESVLIDLQERSYRINIGGGLLGDVATYAALPSAGAALIITNTTVAPLYADALRAVQKAGVKLVIATGRCRAEIPAKMLRGIRPDYWICAAGAQVEDAAGTALYTSHMTAEEMYALVDFCEDYEHPLGFSFSDGGYVYLDYEAFHVQEKAAALEGCLKDGEDQDRHLLDMPFSAFGMLAAEDIAKFQAKYGYLGLKFLPYHVTGCDILRAGQDKATGLQALLDGSYRPERIGTAVRG